MSILKKCFSSLVRVGANIFQGNGLSQDSNFVEGDAPVAVNAADVLRRSAAEGIVMLANDGTLPLAADNRVAIFGRHQYDWFYVGFGSGGDVNAPYRVNLLSAAEGRLAFDEALAARYRRYCTSAFHSADEGWWGAWPRSYPEMPLAEDEIAEYARQNEVAVYVLGRSAGEDRENVLKEGAYYLTGKERAIMHSIRRRFAKMVVVLDVGNVIDMAWVEEIRPNGLLLAYFGGQESGNALVDVLTGAVNPSGKLTDTIARSYTDYPSQCFGNKAYNEYREDIYVGYRYFETFAPQRVLYPFGFGLSYTQFDYDVVEASADADGATVRVCVRNVGNCAGKEVMQLYLEPPQGALGKSKRSLVAFAKTPLLAAGESATLTLSCTGYAMASFDDAGLTGYADSYVLEGGTYRLWVGTDVRSLVEAVAFALPHTVCLQTLRSICRLSAPFDRLVAKEQGGRVVPAYAAVPQGADDLRERILAELPPEVERDERHILWQDVLDGKATIEQFVRCLDLDELEALTRGFGNMHTPLGVAGNGGSVGGITPELRLRGVPPIIMSDGPSGLRVRRYCNLVPSGVCIAASWNPALTRSVFAAVGEEMLLLGVHVLLAPGMNIRRNPLCGRNFEYLSEDPVVSGVMAAAVVEGVQSKGVAACVKHFCCNNQETNRNRNDSRLSARALREIYLKGFEICISLSDPWTLMTAYNLVNGVWCHYNYDLATTVLRREWGYQGLIMTDWWMQHDNSHEFPALRDNAYRVRAGVDVFMPGSFNRVVREYRPEDSLLATVGQEEGLRRAEIERSALATLRLAMRLADKLTMPQ